MSRRRAIAIVTGSRADYGLLRPVMDAVRAHRGLELSVVVTGCHLLPPQTTAAEVEAEFAVAARVAMQRPGSWGRAADAEALGRGVAGFAAWLSGARPDVVVVLGDRIEALAAAAAASVAGVRVAHVHGGDRAPGIADEAIRHAVAKLAHVHLPATEASARRLIRMGEDRCRVHVTGSPAIDGLDGVPPLAVDAWDALGRPRIVFLLHPTGLGRDREREGALALLAACRRAGPLVALHPNHDPGREVIVEAIDRSTRPQQRRAHLPRREFVGLLRRADVLVGNSSAGLIECAALGVPCLNVGPRQDGRERAGNVVDVPWPDDGGAATVETALHRLLSAPPPPSPHPFGDGCAGARAARVLAEFEPRLHPLSKRNTF